MLRSKRSEDIRSDFLQFFAEKRHEIVPSASLVPENDPSLLFTIAGMNQFKDVFLGTGDRPYRRAADTQKILRVSGKHNDLEEVGHDTYHHTFFEMLGNWSFGDYFKKEAISWAWELLVERWGIEPHRLYATVHAGDEELDLERDQEAADLWSSETKIPEDHVLFFGSEDNFWMMGDTGPCGPSSEIHVDLRTIEERKAIDGKTLVNTGHPSVIEIWNLVFIQYDARPDGLLPLADKHVDTGMGFERMVAALQGKGSTYDTDLFEDLFRVIAELSPIPEVDAYDGMERVEKEAQREQYRVAMRVVADHIRACAFAIADGVSPGNVGRSYVIRRILRRAVRYGYQSLQLREPFLHRLVGTLIKKMGPVFPELEAQQDHIERVIKAEEVSFLETLGTGLAFFENITPYVSELQGPDTRAGALKRLTADTQTLDLIARAYFDLDRSTLVERFAEVASEGKLPGQIAFLLHDTYGFPIDLTRLMLREQDLGVDMESYEVLMGDQRNRARAASSFGSDAQSAESRLHEISEGDDSVFVGYDVLSVDDAHIRWMREIEMESNTRFEVVLDKTPFYAESGGQVGDTGRLRVGDQEVHVLDTQNVQEHIVHVVDRLPEKPRESVIAQVDVHRRKEIKKHHTATHLLHAALRESLGTHVVQKGSLVAPERLRFDFSHYERISPEVLHAIEQRVNVMIQNNVPRAEEREVPFDVALERGAMALFGEKYGDTVRVITFDPTYSVELCGGTHVDATGELGLFRFVSEGSVAAGVRRVEAVVGESALDAVNEAIEELNRVRSQFKTRNVSVHEAVAQLLQENKTLEKELAQYRKGQLESQLEAFIGKSRDILGVHLVTGRIDDLDIDVLRDLGQSLRDRLSRRGVAVLGSVDPEGDKAYLVAAVTDDVIEEIGVKAGSFVGILAKKVGGGGGGKPALATAGGRKPELLNEALEEAGSLLESMIQAG